MRQLLYSLFLFFHHHSHLLDCLFQFLQWLPKRKIFFHLEYIIPLKVLEGKGFLSLFSSSNF